MARLESRRAAGVREARCPAHAALGSALGPAERAPGWPYADRVSSLGRDDGAARLLHTSALGVQRWYQAIPRPFWNASAHRRTFELSWVAEVAAFFVPALARGAASPLDIWPLRVDTRTTLENRVKNDYIFSSLAMSKDFSLPMEFSGRVAL